MPGLAASAAPGDVLVTYALGSCLGVTAHDPVAKVGGLLHAMLPSASIAPERAAREPEAFVDTGVRLLIESCERLGAKRDRLVVHAFGAAHPRWGVGGDLFRIGERNVERLGEVLAEYGIPIRGAEVGGTASRTVELEVGSGTVWVTTVGGERVLGARSVEDGGRKWTRRHDR